MIDLHSHLLPGIDDGPGDIRQSLQMLSLYAEAGFHTILATPHWIPGSQWMHSCELVQHQVAELNRAAQKKGLSVLVLSGMEIALDPAIINFLQNGDLCPLGASRTFLIEVPFVQFPIGWQEIFFRIRAAGYRILLAHPERCMQLLNRPELFDELKKCGVYLQVNFESFLGNHGKGPKRMAFRLAAEGRITCLATDSHEPYNRSPGLTAKALEVIGKRLSIESLDTLTTENPWRILHDKTPLAVRPSSRGRSLSFKNKWCFWDWARDSI